MQLDAEKTASIRQLLATIETEVTTAQNIICTVDNGAVADNQTLLRNCGVSTAMLFESLTETLETIHDAQENLDGRDYAALSGLTEVTGEIKEK